MLRIVTAQAAQCVSGIGRTRQPEFVIGGTESGITGYGLLYKAQAQAVVQQLMLLFQGIVRGDEKP